MNDSKKFDEKQLRDRGRAFEYGFLSAIITAAAVYLATDVFEVKIERFTAFLIEIWTPATICFVLLILKDAYEALNTGRGRLPMAVLGVCGAVLAAAAVFGASPLILEGALTERAGELFSGLCMALISAVYWIKQCVNRKKFKDE